MDSFGCALSSLHKCICKCNTLPRTHTTAHTHSSKHEPVNVCHWPRRHSVTLSISHFGRKLWVNEWWLISMPTSHIANQQISNSNGVNRSSEQPSYLARPHLLSIQFSKFYSRCDRVKVRISIWDEIGSTTLTTNYRSFWVSKLDSTSHFGRCLVDVVVIAVAADKPSKE